MAIAREKILEIARTLPAAPRAFAELDRMLRDENRPLADVAALIRRDAALTAHVIRASNSAALGGEQKMGSIEEAVGRVGLAMIFRLVGELSVAQLVDRDLRHYGIEADTLRTQLLQTALACEEIAREAGLDERRAYTVGLMRAIGMLVFDRVADRYARVEHFEPIDGDYVAWEGRLFGLPGTEVAALVLGEWGFPSESIEAVRNQHLLRSDDLMHRLACVVHLAAAAVAETEPPLPGEQRSWSATPWKLEAVGLDEPRFRTAVARAREAWARALGRPVAQAVAPEAAAGAAALSDSGSGKPEEACNFSPPSGVLEPNDAPPVHTTEAGVSPATDFTTFMRNYQNMVFSTAARLTGNDAQAEDISQEVFLKAYENFDHLRTSPTAGGWLKTVATNLSLNHLSRYRNRWRFFSEFKRDDAGESEAPEVEFAAPDTFFSGVDADERRALVERALAELPPHQRVPLVLYHFEDMPYDEIAKKLGVSLAKVKTDILRARAALAKVLTRSGTAHEKISV